MSRYFCYIEISITIIYPASDLMSKVIFDSQDTSKITISRWVTPLIFHKMTPELVMREFGEILDYLQKETSEYVYDDEKYARKMYETMSRFQNKIADEWINKPWIWGTKVSLPLLLWYLWANTPAINKRLDAPSYEEQYQIEHTIHVSPNDLGLSDEEIALMELIIWATTSEQMEEVSKMTLWAYALFMWIFLEETLAVCYTQKPFPIVWWYIKDYFLADSTAIQELLGLHQDIDVSRLPTVSFKASYWSSKEHFRNYKKQVSEYYKDHIKDPRMETSLEFIQNHLQQSMKKYKQVEFKIWSRNHLPTTITEEITIDDKKKFYHSQNTIWSKEYQQVNKGNKRIYKRKTKIPLQSRSELIYNE